MYNGLAERVEVRVEASAALEPQVSPKPEELWTSKEWSNRNPSTIKAGERDPNDIKGRGYTTNCRYRR
jgi:hypothetical protein